MPPGLVRSEGAAGNIALEDAFELFLLEQAISGGSVGLWLRREGEWERQNRVKRAQQLVTELRAGPSDERRRAIEQELDQINEVSR